MFKNIYTHPNDEMKEHANVHKIEKQVLNSILKAQVITNKIVIKYLKVILNVVTYRVKT